MIPRWQDHRAHIDALVEAALRVADPAQAVRRALADVPPGGPSDEKSLWLVGAGKASLVMARAALETLGDRVVGGALCVPAGQEGLTLAPLDLYPAAHPLPDARNLAGASAIRDVARHLGAGESLLCLISGGGSAHLTLPVEGLTLDDLRAVTEALLLNGAPIEALNTVRKHAEQLKGGGLARLAMDAALRALILSDVVGDRLDVIASGPTSPDPTTYGDALAVLDQYGARGASPSLTAHLEAGARGDHPETVKPGDPALTNVENTIVGTNRLALDAAADAARTLGFGVTLAEEPLVGEAREAAAIVTADFDQPGERIKPHATLFGGETTVTVRGQGTGGRNQELALAAALVLDGQERVAVGTFATDGVDGPTDAAGAIATGQTCQRARDLGLDPDASLEDNDSHTLFAALGDLIVTGPTGTNVNDLTFVLDY